MGSRRPDQSRLRREAAGDSERLQRTQAVDESGGNRPVAADRNGGIRGRTPADLISKGETGRLLGVAVLFLQQSCGMRRPAVRR